jgi:hypothetical protein
VYALGLGALRVREDGGIVLIEIVQGEPAAGAGVAVIELVLRVGGAVHLTEVPTAGATVPEVALQLAATGVVSWTCSFTATTRRLLAVPSGAAASVRDVITHAGGGGGVPASAPAS